MDQLPTSFECKPVTLSIKIPARDTETSDNPEAILNLIRDGDIEIKTLEPYEVDGVMCYPETGRIDVKQQ